jgi:hypothetical protein
MISTLRFRQFLTESENTLVQLDYEIYGVISGLSIDEDDFWDIVRNKCIKFFIGRGFRTMRRGRNRLVFLDGNHNVVIKVPSNTHGIDDNYYEYKNQNDSKRIGDRAKNRILVMPKTGIPILVMEKLNLSVSDQERPDWASYYDCSQVGRDRRGRFKAYDYGVH